MGNKEIKVPKQRVEILRIPERGSDIFFRSGIINKTTYCAILMSNFEIKW